MKQHGYVEWYAHRVKLDKKTGEPLYDMRAWPKTAPCCSVCGNGVYHPYHGSRDAFVQLNYVPENA